MRTRAVQISCDDFVQDKYPGQIQKRFLFLNDSLQALKKGKIAIIQIKADRVG